ncbi:hypothetical protein AAFF_G00020040 [Aldrovandia affinis]|uniref:Uncharacterized protein n=1 Tax=Aldrovandia affinis TaxID=143900 RepID=A0AAD7R4M5_9TELE|nr:hypothetical protein AAFF_G00020040 [Aldrovandia affinis]
MRAVLPDLIHPDQSCAVPGRRITDSLVLPLAQVLRREVASRGASRWRAAWLATYCCVEALWTARTLLVLEHKELSPQAIWRLASSHVKGYMERDGRRCGKEAARARWGCAAWTLVGMGKEALIVG